MIAKISAPVPLSSPGLSSLRMASQRDLPTQACRYRAAQPVMRTYALSEAQPFRRPQNVRDTQQPNSSSFADSYLNGQDLVVFGWS